MIKSCDGCRALEEHQGDLSTCYLGYRLKRHVSNIGRLVFADGPESGTCPKPRTNRALVKISLAAQQGHEDRLATLPTARDESE